MPTARREGRRPGRQNSDPAYVAESSIMVTVADCQRVQTDWYRFRAQLPGGEVWTDGPLTWIDGPDGQNLMFPVHLTTASVLDGDIAGVFDMDVWQPFRRRGFGTGLLHAVCAAAREAGARHAVLNATPEGKSLYAARGFTQIGEGITWWHHLGSA
jgi:GNAT superfamily N-acetyltransferase